MWYLDRITIVIFAGIISNSVAVAAPIDVLSCKIYNAEVANVSVMPTMEKKVIMLEFDGGESRGAEAVNASSVLRNVFDTLLGKAGVEVVDTDLLENREIYDAIARYELEGTSEFSSAVATNALSAKLTTVTLSEEFKEATVFSGKTILNSRCNFTATVEGVMKIYDINPLRLSTTTEIKDSELKMVESRSNRCSLGDSESNELVKTAIEEAIKKKASKDLYSAFRSAGYIREIRMCGKTPYVWISTSPSRGASVKAKVKFFAQEDYTDPITKESFNRKRFITEGKVIETQNPDEAWVKLQKRAYVDQLRIGHLAEVEQPPPSALCLVVDFC